MMVRYELGIFTRVTVALRVFPYWHVLLPFFQRLGIFFLLVCRYRFPLPLLYLFSV
jgi:hypothetical protein